MTSALQTTVIISLAFLCTVLAAVLSTVRSCPAVGKSGDYTYDTPSPSGPAGWGLIAGYWICSTGSAQSPINIVTSGSSALTTTPSPSYGIATMDLKGKVENWALECQSSNGCGSISYNGQTYNAFNIHFHSPSEHTINGKRYPLEAHIVHLNGGDIKVMDFLFGVGSVLPNTLPALIMNSICHGSKTLTVALGLLLDTSDGMCTYSGLLTTPPCSEGVQFFIQRKVLKVTQIEMNQFIETFSSPVDASSRPVQNLNDREIMCSD